jgi:hypothetical protein
MVNVEGFGGVCASAFTGSISRAINTVAGTAKMFFMGFSSKIPSQFPIAQHRLLYILAHNWR